MTAVTAGLYNSISATADSATKALAIELASREITLNCVAPGVIETQMVKNLPIDEVTKMIPTRRCGLPEEAAAAVAFLCSDEASYVTRQAIAINGGMN